VIDAPPRPSLPSLPARCQRGHPIVWLLDGSEPFAAKEAIGACACALRAQDGHARGGSLPLLWRVSGPGGLRPIFPSMNRQAFALARRWYAQQALGAPTLAVEAGEGA